MSSSTPHFLRVVRAIAKASGASVPIVAATALTAYAGCYTGGVMGSIIQPEEDGGCSEDAGGADCYDGGAVGVAPHDGGPVGVVKDPDAGMDDGGDGG